MSMKTDLTPLIEVLEAIKPYLSDVVLVGGWVPIVYEHCTSSFPSKMVRTADVDFACLPPLKVKEEPMDQLLKTAGFQCELYGNAKDPLCRYVNDRQLEIEFLTPLKGDGSVAVMELQKGLTAEALRYLDILLAHTREVEVEGHVVRVPLLSAFLFHKGVSFPNRVSSLKKDKDLYYIFKVVEGVGSAPFIAELSEIIRYHPKKWGNTLIQNLQKAFSDEHSPGVGSVVGQLMNLPEEQDNRDSLVMKVFATMDDFIKGLISSLGQSKSKVS